MRGTGFDSNFFSGELAVAFLKLKMEKTILSNVFLSKWKIG